MYVPTPFYCNILPYFDTDYTHKIKKIILNDTHLSIAGEKFLHFFLSFAFLKIYWPPPPPSFYDILPYGDTEYTHKIKKIILKDACPSQARSFYMFF